MASLGVAARKSCFLLNYLVFFGLFRDFERELKPVSRTLIDECNEEVFFDIFDQFAVLQCFHRVHVQKNNPASVCKAKFSTERRTSASTAKAMFLRHKR